MSILKKLGDFVSKITGGTPIIDRLDAATYLDEITDAVSNLAVTLAIPDVTRSVTAVLGGQCGVNADAARLQDIYRDVMKGQSGAVSGLEHRGYLQSLVVFTGKALADLQLIRNGYADLFGDHGPAQLDASQTKIGTVIIIGYIDAMYRTVTWANDFIIACLDVASGNAPGKMNYMFNDMAANAPAANAALGEVLNRRGNQTILSLVADLEKRGRNGFVVVGDRPIDQYMGERDFTASEMTMAAGFMRSPILMMGQHAIERRQLRYEKLRDQQEFLRAKVSIYQRMQINKDPNDPETLRLKKVEDGFRKLLSGVQEKIDRMERADV